MKSNLIIAGLALAILATGGFIVFQLSRQQNVSTVVPEPAVTITSVPELSEEELDVILDSTTPVSKEATSSEIDDSVQKINNLINDLNEEENFADFEDLLSY